MKKTMIMGAMLLTGILSANQSTTAGTDLNNATTWKHVAITAGTDGASLEISKPCQLRAADMIPINPDVTYRLSGELRKAKGAPSALFLAGFVQFDKNKTEIKTQDVRVIPGTDTVLAADAKKGDESIKIKNGARWSAKPNYFAAFNADALPNRDLSPGPIASVKREGTFWTVTFNQPLSKDYKAGSKIRIQASGAHFTIISIPVPTDEWKPFSAEVSGVSTHASNKMNQFWPGTTYIVPMLMPNWNWGSPERDQLKTQLRNLKLEMIKPAK